jgi:hypothetical protein
MGSPAREEDANDKAAVRKAPQPPRRSRPQRQALSKPVGTPITGARHRDDQPATQIPSFARDVATARDAAASHQAPAQSGITTGLAVPSNGTAKRYVDVGSGCESGEAAICFFTPEQRGRYTEVYGRRVGIAETKYLLAISELRVDELLKKDAGTSWILELFIDVIGAVAMFGIARTLSRLASQSVDELASITRDAPGLHAKLQVTPADFLKGAADKAISTGKKFVPKPVAVDHAAANKAANVGYLESLRTPAEKSFQDLRENALAGVDDVQLYVMHEAFDVSAGHTVDDYKRELTSKLREFEASKLSKLGVQRAEKLDDRTRLRVGPFEAGHFLEMEAKLFWVATPLGRKLAFFDRGHKPTPKYVGVPWMVTRLATDEEKAAWEARDLEERPFRFSHFIPKGLHDIGLSMHEARWGAAPEDQPFAPDEMVQMM